MFSKKSLFFSANLTLSLAVLLGFLAYSAVTWKEPPAFLKLTPLQENEEEWLAKAIYFEARGEGVKGQMEVAKVVLQRVADKRWPNTVFDVVTQGKGEKYKCQFSFWCDGEADVPRNQNAWELAKYVASVAYRQYLRGQAKLGCEHSYHATYAKNTGYFKTLSRSKQVGEHIFYCD